MILRETERDSEVRRNNNEPRPLEWNDLDNFRRIMAYKLESNSKQHPNYNGLQQLISNWLDNLVVILLNFASPFFLFK